MPILRLKVTFIREFFKKITCTITLEPNLETFSNDSSLLYFSAFKGVTFLHFVMSKYLISVSFVLLYFKQIKINPFTFI